MKYLDGTSETQAHNVSSRAYVDTKCSDCGEWFVRTWMSEFADLCEDCGRKYDEEGETN